MKITALSSQSFASQNIKSNKASAQSQKAQQYFADSVSFSGKIPLPKVSKLRAGIIGLAATLLAAGGFTAGTVTANAAQKEQTTITYESEEFTPSALKQAPAKVSKEEKKEIKQQIKETRAKVVKNNKKIDEIKDTQNKLEFLKYAKTKSGYAHTSTVNGDITVNPYAEYFEYIERAKKDPYCAGCSDHFYQEEIEFLDRQIAGSTNEAFIAQLEAQKAEVTAKHEEELRKHEELEQQREDKIRELEIEADEKALDMLAETDEALNKLTGSAKSPKEKIQQLKAANKKLLAKLEKLCNKIMEPNIPISDTKVKFPESTIPSTFIRPTDAQYAPGFEPWEADYTTPTTPGEIEIPEPCHCGDYEH